MRGTIIALVLAGAGCLGRYNAPPDPAPAPPAQSQPAAPAGQPPTPPTAPAPPQTPPPAPPSSDGGTTTPAPASDGGAPSACAQLEACCQDLPPDQIQGCLDQVAALDEAICQGILDQLQGNGYCL